MGRHHPPTRTLEAIVLGGWREFQRELIKAGTEEGSKSANEGCDLRGSFSSLRHQRRDALARRHSPKRSSVDGRWSPSKGADDLPSLHFVRRASIGPFFKDVVDVPSH